MKKIILVIVTVVIVPFISDATIVHNSNVALLPGGYYTLDIQQDVAGTDNTSAFFDTNTTQIIYMGPSLDAGLTLSFANYGDTIPEPPLTVETPLNFNQSYDVGYTNFYLAFYADPATTATTTNKITGWVHLENTPSGLSLLENAVAYDNEPMTVGVVPEPSSVALLLTGGGLLYLRRKKYSQQAHGPYRENAR